jgi:hypothetical protein
MRIAGRIWSISLGLAAGLLLRAGVAYADGVNLDVPMQSAQAAPPAATSEPLTANQGLFDAIWDYWRRVSAEAQASQPHWASPVITSTPMLENRIRFDNEFQHAGNGADTTVIDGGRGIDVIVSDTEEVQIAAPPYVIRSTNTTVVDNKVKKGSSLEGFNDWAFLRLKQRIVSAPEGEGDYIVTAWLQFQAPTGIEPLTNHAFTLIPTLAFGKGFGPFVTQGTVGATIPTAYQDKAGTQIVTNVAFQYQVFRYFWPELEVNWTYYANGIRGGKNQVYLSPGLVISRIPITSVFQPTIGLAYQSAVAPSYRPTPLLPSYNHAWVVTARWSF